MSITFDSDVVYLSQTLISQYTLINSSRPVRLITMSILINSSDLKQPYSDTTLLYLRHCIPQMQSDTDPGLRSEVLSLLKGLLRRMRYASYTLQRLQLSSDTYSRDDDDS